MSYFVYILQSLKDGSYYIGSTRDLDERIQRHNQGRSTYTKAKKPWSLVFSEEHPNKSSALKRENQIKQYRGNSLFKRLIKAPAPSSSLA